MSPIHMSRVRSCAANGRTCCATRSLALQHAREVEELRVRLKCQEEEMKREMKEAESVHQEALDGMKSQHSKKIDEVMRNLEVQQLQVRQEMMVGKTREEKTNQLLKQVQMFESCLLNV